VQRRARKNFENNDKSLCKPPAMLGSFICDTRFDAFVAHLNFPIICSVAFVVKLCNSILEKVTNTNCTHSQHVIARETRDPHRYNVGSYDSSLHTGAAHHVYWTMIVVLKSTHAARTTVTHARWRRG